MKRNINELAKLAKTGSGTDSHSAMQPTPKSLTVADIDSQLGGQLGRPDLGIIGNMRANKHIRQAQLDVWKKISTEKYEQLGGLAVDALKAEAQLIREKLRIDWNHQYAALAERAAVGEMTVVRKLEAVLEAGRELLYGDRADAIERLEMRHADGWLTDEDFANELGYLFDRYTKLREEFINIVNERETSVRSAFRNSITTP